jgi:hypothetical protein
MSKYGLTICLIAISNITVAGLERTLLAVMPKLRVAANSISPRVMSRAYSTKKDDNNSKDLYFSQLSDPDKKLLELSEKEQNLHRTLRNMTVNLHEFIEVAFLENMGAMDADDMREACHVIKVIVNEQADIVERIEMLDAIREAVIANAAKKTEK